MSTAHTAPAAHRAESTRIQLRTSPQVKALIERAAASVGTSLSSFMLQNAWGLREHFEHFLSLVPDVAPQKGDELPEPAVP